jgi:glycosyltransferase involved in cell wall biosynthesis
LKGNIKVTIGICVKDCESTIKEAIDSIIAQDFPHEQMEAIFVDDGSEDGTLSLILDSLPRFDIEVKVFHNSWKGLGPARNTVVNSASGDYIVWVDGDMVLPIDHVRKQVEFMLQNPTVGIGKARYGTYPGETLVGALENISFQAADFKYGGKVTSTVRALGTGGCIYRVKAIKQVGGFDKNISGVGEDADAEYRVRKAGWFLYRGTPALFYERRRKTWKDLFEEGFWHGYGAYDVFRKNTDLLVLYRLVPLAGFIAGVWYSIIAYKLLRRKWVFLLPIEYFFKRTAWFFGFIKGQIDGHKHADN